MAHLESLAAARQGQSAPFGVIDIGSNSVRLVVFSGPARAPAPMFNEKMLCGLGRGQGETGRLDEDGMAMALAALKRFVALARAMGVVSIQAVATAAVRDAANGELFVARAQRECDLQIRVVTGAEEAMYSALGVISGIPEADGLMGDMGGGSLELVNLAKGVPGEGVTLPLGSLRLAGIRDQDALRDRIDEHLATVKWIKSGRGRDLVLVGGSWRGIARIHMAHARYPLRIIHQYRIAANEADDLTRLLARQSRDSLSRIPGVSKRRLEGMPLAALVLRRLIKAADPGHVVFSAHGLREGLSYAALPERARKEDPLLAACRDIAAREGRFGDNGELLSAITAPLFGGETPAWKRLRLAACHLCDIAWRLHPDHRGEYVLNRILNDPFGGIDHGQRAALAYTVAVRYTGETDAPEIEPVRKLVPDTLLDASTMLGLALRLAQTMTGGTGEMLAQIKLRVSGTSLVLEVQNGAADLVGDVVERRLEALARMLDCTPQIKVARKR
jgi:exopolyphosphatase/guanosine-5'-triphosphate,3'-diphosphate pyrophosphatase